MNELTEKWEKTGLLEGIEDDSIKNKCAASLDATAYLLIGEMDEYRKEVDKKMEIKGFLAGTILPIVRRIYNEYPEKSTSVSLKWLIKDFGEFAKKNCLLLKDLNSYIAAYGEAELVALYMFYLKDRIVEEVELKITSKPFTSGYMKYAIGNFTIDRDKYWFLTDAERQALHDQYDSGSKAIPFDPKFAEKYGKNPNGPF